MNDDFYMTEALKEAQKSYDIGDVPVGAIIVKNGKIIARAHNTKESQLIAVNHAEINVIKQACQLLESWRLDECTLYVTLEPCLMCAGAILQSRIAKLVYGAESKKFGFVESINNILDNEKNNHKVEIIKNVCDKQSQQLLRDFFANKRN